MGGMEENTPQKGEGGRYFWRGKNNHSPRKGGAGTFGCVGEGKALTLPKKEEGEVSQVPSDGQQSRTE